MTVLFIGLLESSFYTLFFCSISFCVSDNIQFNYPYHVSNSLFTVLRYRRYDLLNFIL
uniref:Uncharacterized protein n=1 Tax=Ciona intestinalis TaxID=7719 RepID=H2XZJ0_CIOIN